MNAIIVCRTGSPIYYDDNGTPRGDADTVPLIKYLAETYDGLVIVIGAQRGTPPDYPNLKCVLLDTHFDENDRVAYLEAKFDAYVEEVKHVAGDHHIECCIEMFGAPPTWSWPGNPNYARTQGFAVRYSAPQLYVMHKLKLKRYGIVTDPKVYKRDLEMASIWPECRPLAVLSQESRVFNKKMYDQQYKIRAVYSGCEFWLTRDMKPREYRWPKEHPMMIAANSHVGKTGLIRHDRQGLWQEIIDACPNGTAICGTGWDWLDDQGRLRMLGTLPTMRDVLSSLSNSVAGPMIPQYPGFNSTKPRLYALAGCAPLPYGPAGCRFPDWAYDRDERLLDLNSPWRFPGPKFDAKPDDYVEYIERVLDITTPDFTLLDQLIDATRSNVPVNAAWYEKFGGYYKV